MLRETDPMFSGKYIWKLLLPLIVEQIFTALMGTADTMMVARVGDAAVSAVSLVDALNNLMLMVFTATATGCTIACAQDRGGHDFAGANTAARQVFLCVAVIALACCLGCVALRRPCFTQCLAAWSRRSWMRRWCTSW